MGTKKKRTSAGSKKASNKAKPWGEKQFPFRCSAAQYDAYMQVATELGLPAAAWMRNVLDQAVAKYNGREP